MTSTRRGYRLQKQNSKYMYLILPNNFSAPNAWQYRPKRKNSVPRSNCSISPALEVHPVIYFLPQIRTAFTPTCIQKLWILVVPREYFQNDIRNLLQSISAASIFSVTRITLKLESNVIPCWLKFDSWKTSLTEHPRGAFFNLQSLLNTSTAGWINSPAIHSYRKAMVLEEDNLYKKVFSLFRKGRFQFRHQLAGSTLEAAHFLQKRYRTTLTFAVYFIQSWAFPL